MKIFLKRSAIVGTALLLCIAALLGLTATQASADTSLDFGIDGVKTNQTIPASSLFEQLFGETPSPNEAAYLDGFSGISFIYNNAIPDSLLATKYNGDLGRLSVSLPAYSYTAANATVVEWIPTLATIDGKSSTFTLKNGQYVCEFDQLFYSGDFKIKVDFTWNATIPADAVDTLLTLTYTQASAALTELQAYETAFAAYTDAKNKRLAYEAYLEAADAYKQYAEIDKPAYDKAYADYTQQKAQYDRYLAKLEAYEAWQQYWAYQEFMTDDMQTKYLAYQAYLSKIAPIKEKLAILDTLFVSDSHGWQLYASLMGNTVTQVVNGKKELILAGCSESDINNAGDSTNELRRLMQAYAELRSASYGSEHARLTALYQYYTANYNAIVTQFDKLYTALKRLTDKAAVITELSRRGKLEHFRQFIGQLYYTQAALDDSESINSNTVVSGVTVGSAVEACQQLTDRNSASPGGVLMPKDEVAKVDKVEQIDRPTFEEVHDKPTLAEFGLQAVPVEPTAPPVVEEPDTVAFAPLPGEEPDAPKLDERLRAVAEDLRNKELKKREARGKSEVLTLKQSVTRNVSISNLKTISFYSADGKTLIDSQTLEYGTPFSYRGTTDVQNRPSDERCHYQFLGWILPNGEAPSELRAVADMSLYANYSESPRFYSVTWILDGKTELQSLPYGALPTSPLPTVKETDAAFSYTFSGWDKDLAPVTQDVTYTASFIATPRTYTVTWIAGDTTKTDTLPYGAVPSFDGIPTKAPSDRIYEFIGWDRDIAEVTCDVTYTARFGEIQLAIDEFGMPLNIIHEDEQITVEATGKRADIREAAIYALANQKALSIRWSTFSLTIKPDQLPTLIASRAREIGILSQSGDNGSILYQIGYLNSAGGKEPIAVQATLQILTNESGGQLVGYIQGTDGWSMLTENSIAISGEVSFRVSDVHKLTVSANEPVNLSKLPRFAESGIEILLSQIGCEFGYEITAAKLILPDGTEVPVTGAFRMPSSAATLELTVKKIVYNVSFLVDGKVIHTAQYGSGEEIGLPEAPTKAPDELYTYTFTGWSPEVPTIAYGETRELVFEAVFSKKLTDPNTFTPDRSAFYLFLGIAGGAFLLIAAATVALILILRRRKKRKKMAELPKNEMKKPLTSTESTDSPCEQNGDGANRESMNETDANTVDENGDGADPKTD
ncbi:MAG: hypothetical protein E7666_03855 [Ruminococcaceae bacterium]|nr:hypothetical protein [Oscillospiraceae bacterium]